MTAKDVNSRISIFFYVQAFLVFMSVAVIPFFIQQRGVFIREKTNGAYAILPYCLSNFLCSVPGLFIISLVSSILVVFPAKLNGFGVFLASLFLSLVIAESIMNLISALVPHYILGIAIGAGFFGFCMLCEGFFIVVRLKFLFYKLIYLFKCSKIPGWYIWGYYIAFHTYSFRQFMYNEFSQGEISKKITQSYFTNGYDVLEYYGMAKNRQVDDFVILMCYAFIIQIALYIVLRRKYKSIS